MSDRSQAFDRSQARDAARVSSSPTNLPLAGLRVVDVSTFVAGPLGGMTLAQLGADVIRVDPIGGAADRGRWPVTSSGASLYWNGLNKGKRSLCLDLRSAAGQHLLRSLVEQSGPDGGVLITNSVRCDGFEYEQLRDLRADVIYVHIMGRHDGSPAVDYTVNAGVGFPMVTGPPGHADPINHVLPAWDIACGLLASVAVLAAERRRRLTGEGQYVSIALEDVALAMAGNLGFLDEAQVNRVTRPRIGNHLYGGFARDFTCRGDKRIMIVALTGRHWKDLIRVTGMSDAVKALEVSLHVDFSGEEDRFTYREVLAGLFATWFQARTRNEVAEALSRTSLLWSDYRTFAEVVESGLAGNPLMQPVDQPDVGIVLTPGSPLRFGGDEPTALAAPTLGQDTDQILCGMLDYDAAAVEEMARTGVIGRAKQAFVAK